MMNATGHDDPLLKLTLGSIYSAAPPPSAAPGEAPGAPAPPPVEPYIVSNDNGNGAMPSSNALAPGNGVTGNNGGALSSVAQLPAQALPQANQQLEHRPRRRRNILRSNRNAEAHKDAVKEQSPPFPWSINCLAQHYSLIELHRRGINIIEGESQCKRCQKRLKIAYNLEAKFREVANFITANRHVMDDRAPNVWNHPIVPDCEECGQTNGMRPVIPSEKENINWLFLLLGQTLGLCTLEQLKHFCGNTKKHRTGAKDRVLYSTYLELCHQLWPDGTFNVSSDRSNRFIHF